MTRNGRTVDAVAQITKYGYVFVLDRRTGDAAVSRSSMRKVPPSDDRRREAAPRRSRIRSKPPPFARQGLTEDDADDAHARGARGGARAVPED